MLDRHQKFSVDKGKIANRMCVAVASYISDGVIGIIPVSTEYLLLSPRLSTSGFQQPSLVLLVLRS